MENIFRTIKAKEISESPFSLIGQDWMLITSGSIDKFNTMTASWGGMGFLWGKNVCFIFVRPSRYTYEFMEKNDNFSLSFFTEEFRPALNICGKKSGREIDKVKETGLKPISLNNGTTGFEQAKLIIECKKMYFQDITPEHFMDNSIKKFYPNEDYHRMYVGEILSVIIK